MWLTHLSKYKVKSVLALRVFSTSCVIFFMIGCKKPSTHQPFNLNQVEIEVRKMFDDYHTAINKEGLKGEFDFLDSSEAFYWVPPGYTSALDYDSVHSILNHNSDLFSSVEIAWQSLQVFPLSSKIATFTGIVQGSMLDTSGFHSDIHLIESGTVIKRTDGWKLLSGQTRSLSSINENDKK